MAARRDPWSCGSVSCIICPRPAARVLACPSRLSEALKPRRAWDAPALLPFITREIEDFNVVKNHVNIDASSTLRRGGAPPSAPRPIFPADKEQLLASFD